MFKIKNMGNLPVFLDVYSLQTFCHIRRFVLIRFVSVDVLPVHVLSQYTVCLFRRYVRSHFVTFNLLLLYVLLFYALSFRRFVVIYFVTESLDHLCKVQVCSFLQLTQQPLYLVVHKIHLGGRLNRKSLNEDHQFVLNGMGHLRSLTTNQTLTRTGDYL